MLSEDECLSVFQLSDRFNSVEAYKKLSEESKGFWDSLLADISSKPKAVIRGRPNKDLQLKGQYFKTSSQSQKDYNI
jgi:hypothetical protein